MNTVLTFGKKKWGNGLLETRDEDFFFFAFLGPRTWHMEVSRLGWNWSHSCWPMPQPQQHGTQASSAAYTTEHGNAGSPTARPGIEPASSWISVRFVSVAPQWEL